MPPEQRPQQGPMGLRYQLLRALVDRNIYVFKRYVSRSVVTYREQWDGKRSCSDRP